MEDTELLYSGKIFRVVRHVYRGRDGQEHVRSIVRHPGAVVILPLVDGERLCLLRNYRASVQEELIELPAGTLEPGEDPLDAAARELAEETGYRAGKLQRLTSFLSSPGFCDERLHIYLATDLTPGQQALEPGEEIVTEIVTLQEALEMAADGRICDGKTLIGLLFYERFCKEKKP